MIEILEKIKSHFGIVDRPYYGPTYILPDGSLLDLDGRGHHSTVEHWLIENGLSNREYIKTGGSPTIEVLGCIRCDMVKYYIGLSEEQPTREQYNSLLVWLDQHSRFTKVITVISPGGEQSTDYKFNSDFISDDVVDRIRRYYISGKLYEQLDKSVQFRRQHNFKYKREVLGESLKEGVTSMGVELKDASEQELEEGMKDKIIESASIKEIFPTDNGYHDFWKLNARYGVHNDGGRFHVIDMDNGNQYIFNSDSIDEVNNYIKTELELNVEIEPSTRVFKKKAKVGGKEVAKQHAIREMANLDFEVGHTFDPDDFNYFKKVCKEDGWDVTEDDFAKYFEYLDEIRSNFYTEDLEEAMGNSNLIKTTHESLIDDQKKKFQEISKQLEVVNNNIEKLLDRKRKYDNATPEEKKLMDSIDYLKDVKFSLSDYEQKQKHYMKQLSDLDELIKNGGNQKMDNLKLELDEHLNNMEDQAYTKNQLFSELKEVTNNFTTSEDTIRVGYEDEKDHIIEILSENNYEFNVDKNGEWFEIKFWKEKIKENYFKQNLIENFNCQCSYCNSKYNQLPLGKYGLIRCSQCGGRIQPLPKDGTVVKCPSCNNDYLLAQTQLKYDVHVCGSCGDQLIIKADDVYKKCDSCNKFINIRKNKKCPICGGSPITEGYSKYGHSWVEKNGMIYIYSDGNKIGEFPDRDSAFEAGYDLDNLRESRDPFDHHDPEYSEKEVADTIAYELDRAKNLKYGNSIDEKENKGLKEYYDEYDNWIPDVKKPKAIKGSDFEEFCDYYMTKYDFECRAKYADFSEKNGMVEVQYLAQEYMDEDAALYLGDLVNKWMVNNGYQGKTIEIAASDRSGDYPTVYIKFIVKRGYKTTENDFEYEYEVNDVNDTFDPEWFDDYDDARKFAENKAKDQYVRRNTDWIGIYKSMKDSDNWKGCGGVNVESLLDPEDKELVLEWIGDNANLSDEEFEKFQLKSLEEIIAFIKQDSSLHIKFKEDFGDDNLNESLDSTREKALKMKENSNAFAILYGYKVKDKEVELEPEEYSTEKEYKDRIQQITNSFTKLSDKDPRGNRYGKEHNITFYTVYPNRKQPMTETIEKWNIGSDKSKLTQEELDLLERLAQKLEVNSPNGYKYAIQSTYEDYGSGMKWWNIICYNKKGYSWQVLNTKDWLDLMNTGNVDSVYQSVVNDKYFQDKQKEINEMSMWEMFESIKED